MSSHGTVAWTEFNTFDVAGARAFYGAVFGWEFEAMPHQDGSEYTICKKDGQPVAGIFDMTPVPMLKGIPSHWLTYFAVEDMARRPAVFSRRANSRRDLLPVFMVKKNV